jgi:hypothetical protein
MIDDAKNIVELGLTESDPFGTVRIIRRIVDVYRVS